MTAPVIDLSFPHCWKAEILAARPLILPPRHYIYPQAAEEVERGALEVLIQPNPPGAPGPGSPRTGLRPWGGGLDSETWESTSRRSVPDSRPFLATCALGFRDPAVPTGIWSAPNPDDICAVSGGYAYLIDTTDPRRFTMIPYRPVLEVRPLPAFGLILFVGHHAILAWGVDGLAWESERLSSEGISIKEIEGYVIRGLGWDMMTDTETPFALDLRTGKHVSTFSR